MNTSKTIRGGIGDAAPFHYFISVIYTKKNAAPIMRYTVTS